MGDSYSMWVKGNKIQCPNCLGYKIEDMRAKARLLSFIVTFGTFGLGIFLVPAILLGASRQARYRCDNCGWEWSP